QRRFFAITVWRQRLKPCEGIMAPIGKTEFKACWNSFDRSIRACESFRRWGEERSTAARVMAWAGLALFAALTVGAHTALAVDVVNRDKVQRDVTVNRAD